MKDIFKFLKEHNETSELEDFVENITDAELEEVSQEFLDETVEFEPHTMYDPKTGKGYKAEKEEMNESSVTRNRIANAMDKASGRNQKDRIKDAQVATKRRQDAEKDLAAFRKKNALGEVSVAKLSDYSRASTSSAGKPRQDVHTMDKRIGGQKTADDKIRKSQGKSSNARVAGTEATNELSIDTMIGYKQKAKYSKHRANNSKVANLLRKEPQDPKDDETLRKRKVGDKLYMKKAYKVLRGEATNEAKKPVSQMTPKEKAAADARRKEYNAYQKSKREEGVIDEKKNSQSNYDLYHSSFSGAMQHAYKHAKDAHGITVHSSEIDDKVASGPRKPVNGKTNTYRLKGDKGNIQVQVYNKGGSKPFELNMYKESVVEDVEMIIESVSPKQIAMLKKQYSDMPDRLPLDQAQKMSKMVAKFDKEALMKVAKADIKWISSVAKTNLISKHGATAKDFKEDMLVHGAPSHSADKKPQNYRKPDGKMGVKMVPMDPQTTRKESVEIDEATDFKSTFDGLKKGDIVKIKYGSAISKQQEGTFKVTFKSIVGKAKVGKITLVKQGEGAAKVKHYLYDRNGKVSMAMGDMGASMTSLVKESILEDYFPEKLSVDQGLGAWIRDFSKSDAPSLKGKSAGKRKSMAYVAFKSAQEK
tara:strand:- start:950 stop:2887 length:1938 start_codon:yes stop_codon:yes gene_type:complete